MEGIRTMLILPMIDIGTNSIGKVIPMMTPKLDTASLVEYPDSINMLGMIRVVRGCTRELARRTPVIGVALFNTFLYSPGLKFNFECLK